MSVIVEKMKKQKVVSIQLVGCDQEQRKIENSTMIHWKKIVNVTMYSKYNNNIINKNN
jgi:hypothetical protein